MKAENDQIQQLQALLRTQSTASDAHSEADTLRQQLAEQQTTIETQRSQLASLPQLQSEIARRDEELSSIRGSLSTLESKHDELTQRYESCLKLNTLLKEETEKSKSELQGLQESSSELLSLREANESLKSLLGSAESKYVRVASLNSELQKKVEILEQEQIRKESVSINMRPVNFARAKQGNDSDSDEAPLVAPRNQPFSTRAKFDYMKLRRSFKRLPQELQRLITIYAIFIHVILFIAIVK